MFIHRDTKFAISVFDEDTFCVEIKGVGELHFDLAKGSMTVASDDFSIHELAALFKGTQGKPFHEQVMAEIEEEAHTLNATYEQYKSRLN